MTNPSIIHLTNVDYIIYDLLIKVALHFGHVI